MSNEQINISDFPKHIFWNYNKDAKLDKRIVIEHVILYGELSDYKKLMTIVNENSLAGVLNEMEKSRRYKKRINFVKKVLLCRASN